MQHSYDGERWQLMGKTKTEQPKVSRGSVIWNCTFAVIWWLMVICRLIFDFDYRSVNDTVLVILNVLVAVLSSYNGIDIL